MSYHRYKRSMIGRLGRSRQFASTIRMITLWGGIVLVWAELASVTLHYERNKAEWKYQPQTEITVQPQ